MRNYCLLFAFSLTFTFASAQDKILDIGVLDRDLNMFKVSSGASWEQANGLIGNAFFDEDWDKGYIRLEDGRMAKDLSLKFNVYTNEIYLKRDSQVLVLDAVAIRIAEFGIAGTERSAVFHRGFPAIGTHTTSTFYEVLAAGKLTLLKLHSKKIVQRTNLDHITSRQISDAESWYAFDARTNNLSEFRQNKNSLIGALPACAADISILLDKDKLKIKSDTDLVAFFNALNSKL